MQLFVKFLILCGVKASVKSPKTLILSGQHIGAKQHWEPLKVKGKCQFWAESTNETKQQREPW